MRIAIDAMGGDQAPRPIVAGAIAAARREGCGLLLVGRREEVSRELARFGDLGDLDIELVDAPDVIAMDESPAATLRRRPHASIRVAAERVAHGAADALFSAGHTGATIVAAHATLGMLPGVDRPALVTPIPTRRHQAVLLDAGATVECRPAHLVQFALMGHVFARFVLGIARPRVGLLSIGEEASKGTELVREAHRQLVAAPIHFIGNVEARDAYSGEADVIVCDGFTGNVVLKVSEGLVETIEALLHEELSSTVTRRVGYLLSRNGFRRFRRRVDYSEYGGAPLMGVAGACIVGHGRSSAKAVENAVRLAVRTASEGLVDRIRQEIAQVPVSWGDSR